jgi:hypothetical protein
MAAFISIDGESQLPPPYRFPDVSINSFKLEGTIEAIQQLCDKLLNIGAREERGFEYYAASKYVDLEILHYPRMECTSPPFADQGFSTQNEIYFRVMVAKMRISGNLIVFDSIGLFVPFIFVDNPWSVISGREVIAFSKNLAKFEPDDPAGAGPYPMKVFANVFNPYDPNTCLRLEEIVSIQGAARAAGSKPPTGPWPWGDIDFSGVNDMVQDFVRYSSDISQPRFSMIGLKQFRDAQNPSNACYQALVESEGSASNIVFDDLPPADVSIARYDSLQIAKSLGFPQGTLTPIREYNLRCDLTFGNCRNIYVAR